MKLKEILSDVLEYPKVQEQVNKGRLSKDKVKRYVKEIRAKESSFFQKWYERVLDFIFPRIYDDLSFKVAEGMDLKQMIKDNHVVLVPNHQSHADYVALYYSMYKKFRVTPYTAGGINLNIFPLGFLFRKAGCFFIRRRFAANIPYKVVFEAYLYHLLKRGKPVEFFFEGGRSRTGKLRKPRFGLFQMLIEVHKHLPQEFKKELLFLPVSILHEYVPEQKSLTREMIGKKKTTEKTRQLIKLLRLFSIQLGVIHIHVGNPIKHKVCDEVRESAYELGFDCFRAVGKNMLITPMSLLSLILLDDPQGAIKWEEILGRARRIVDYCLEYKIPLTPSLIDSERHLEINLKRAVNILLSNKKLLSFGRKSQGHVFYAIKKEARREMMYFKNTIIHHFFVPWIITIAWINLFTGRITTNRDLQKLFINQRKQLKREFYLPDMKAFFVEAKDIISNAVGKPIENLEDCFAFSPREFYAIIDKLSVFSRIYTYIAEAYYLSALAIRELYAEGLAKFPHSVFLEKAKEVFLFELKLGRVIQFEECFTTELVDNSLQYYGQEGVIDSVGATHKTVNIDHLESIIRKYERDLVEPFSFNIRTT